MTSTTLASASMFGGRFGDLHWCCCPITLADTHRDRIAFVPRGFIAIPMLLAETSGSFKAYGVTGHRHLPEIREILSRHCQQDVDLTFIPHLAPMVRGIHATLYGKLNQQADLQALFEARYQHEPFVDVMPAGSMPETRSVQGANVCRIAVHQPQGSDTVVVLSVIDNLVKGASGQAIQNMNIMFGLEETMGINVIATMP